MHHSILAVWLNTVLPAFLLALVSFPAYAVEEQDSIMTLDEWLVSDTKELFLPAFHEQKDLKGKTFEIADLLKSYPLPFDNPGLKTDNQATDGWHAQKADAEGDLRFKTDQQYEIAVVSQALYLETPGWSSVKVHVASPQCFELYLNGSKMLSKYSFTSGDAEPKEEEAELKLEPGKHLLLINSLYNKDSSANWRVKTKLSTSGEGSAHRVETALTPDHHMDIEHLLHGKQLRSVSIDPGGNMLMHNYSETFPPEGDTDKWTEVINAKDQQLVFSSRNNKMYNIKWTPLEGHISYLIKYGKQHKIVLHDLKTHKEKVLYASEDELSNYQWSNDGSFIIFSRTEKPDKNSTGVKKYEGMPDRWPWWQNRQQLFLLDLNDRSVQRLTSGHVSNRLQDIHPDGKKILITQNVPDFKERPYSRQYLIELELADLSCDTLWQKNYSSSVNYSPDGSQLLVTGSPALFGDLGTNVKKGQTPNDYDTQAYLYDLEKKTADPITRSFNPSIERAIWSEYNNKIYFLAEDSTYKRIYVLDPEEKNIEHLNADADVVKGISLAKKAPIMAYSGNGIDYPSRSYLLDLASNKHLLISDPEKEFFNSIQFGKTEEWIFKAKGGYEIDGRIYYPPDFDPRQKYPLIVYYYGGTSPTERSFRGRYPKNLFAAMGYVVYVLQPSGATGYGQEFSARHVNNWGITVADEIIEGTRQFLKEHPFIDPDGVGCIGASYGGFMTMLLTTRTDIFSAAIAHAGISSISSYWGQGYWGYLYSSAATANSFPWNNRDIYVEQSPLFNADKVSTPLLLLTGGADTNVPPGESIQFYTALKLLGKPVELIEIEGQNHHILDYKKRILWQKTIFAWFDKWLKGESGWWDELYPEKEL
jgi:dipeptidyl aminopeptidase/acylaminoacyl peptidase